MKEQIAQWCEEIFQETDFIDCMLIEINVSKQNKVEVFLDSDSGMTFQKCQRISRRLEERIEEANLLGEKYTLEVSSPGAKRPMKFFRQYPKHIGRNLKVQLQTGDTFTGKLISTQDNEISLETLSEEKKRKEKKVVAISFSEIESAIVIMPF